MDLICSFCGTKESGILPVHQGATANICVDCLEILSELKIERKIVDTPTSDELLKPHEIKAELDKYVIGQEEAKKILSVEVYNHFKRLKSKSKIAIEKTNIGLVGPSGSGKTLLVEVLAKVLNVPFVISDATSLTEAGYVGKDVETMIVSLIEKCGGDISKAEKGIIYIDEIDKIVSKGSDLGRRRDVGGEGVQQALLKMIEGTELIVEIPDPVLKKRDVTINTRNILFIVGGAFVGIDEIMKNRLNSKPKRPIGFRIDTDENISKNEVPVAMKAITDDIVKYGFIEEFVGRVPLIVTLHKLSEEDFINILANSHNSIIKQYQELFKMDKVKLKFEKEALKYVAQEAMKQKVGARALKGILAQKMNELQYEIPLTDVKEFIVTREYLENR